MSVASSMYARARSIRSYEAASRVKTMTSKALRSLKKCFLAAPPGMDLHALPEILADKQISWEWARDDRDRLLSPAEAIHGADFLVAVLVGTRNDYQIFYEIGIAVGMDKPVFLIARGRHIPLDLSRFPIARVPLSNRNAL